MKLGFVILWRASN